MKVFFSIIIPTLNEEKLLPRLLEALKKQTYKNFEVILVDANSTDNTIEIAKKYSKNMPLHIVSTSEKNISHSRNLGAESAKGDFIFFIDADNYIPHDYLKKVTVTLNRGIEMIVPAIRPDSEKFKYKIAYILANFLVFVAVKLKLPFSTGGNFVIKKNVFKMLHGFDERIFIGEDHDIVGRAQRKKVNILFSPHPKVVFSVRRFEKEGSSVIVKYVVSTLYIAFFGKITKKIYNYQMGGDYFKKG